MIKNLEFGVFNYAIFKFHFEFENYDAYFAVLIYKHLGPLWLRKGTSNLTAKRKDQAKDNRTSTLAIPQSRRIISTIMVSKVSNGSGNSL